MFTEKLIQLARSARRVVVLTGAGISAESGVPTFRGVDGIWKKYRPEELANFDSFIRNPALVWEWYQYRRTIISKVNPNVGHEVLARMEHIFHEFWLITQNVDGLHVNAGNHNVLELHGNIMRNRCLDCDNRYTVSNDFCSDLSYCSCGGLLRPDVVWFGETLPEHVLNRSFRVSQSCDLFISIGTSALVQPAASLPLIAKNANAYVVEINTDKTIISMQVHEFIQGKSGDILPKFLECL